MSLLVIFWYLYMNKHTSFLHLNVIFHVFLYLFLFISKHQIIFQDNVVIVYIMPKNNYRIWSYHSRIHLSFYFILSFVNVYVFFIRTKKENPRFLWKTNKINIQNDILTRSCSYVTWKMASYVLFILLLLFSYKYTMNENFIQRGYNVYIHKGVTIFEEDEKQIVQYYKT